MTPTSKPIFDLLGDDFRLDDPKNIIEIACEGAAVIPRSTSTLSFMAFLTANGLFDYEDEANILYLPVDKRQAAILERSPYGDPPIESYAGAIVQLIEQVTPTETFAAAKAGDKTAEKKLLDWFRGIQSAYPNGLETAKVFIAFPYSAEDQARDEAERAERKVQ